LLRKINYDGTIECYEIEKDIVLDLISKIIKKHFPEYIKGEKVLLGSNNCMVGAESAVNSQGIRVSVRGSNPLLSIKPDEVKEKEAKK